MADFPKIDSPCPLRLQALPRAGADFCGQCSRRVHDLGAMGAAQRRAFMASCGDAKVCVAYTLPMPRARVAGLGYGVGLVAAIVAAPVLANDPLAVSLQSPLADPLQPAATAPVDYCPDSPMQGEMYEDSMIFVGGVSRADAAEWSDGESLLAELPRGGADAFLDAEGVSFGPAPE